MIRASSKVGFAFVLLFGFALTSFADYEWNTVLPSSSTGGGGSLNLGGIVTWDANDGNLTTGTIGYSLSNEGGWVGQVTSNYSYTSGSLTGTFANASLTFAPSLPSGTVVTITYTATGSGGPGVTYQSIKTKTYTVD